jgi:MFS family permease
LRLLRARPDFGKLWAAATVSAVGSQVSALALPLTAILLLRAGPLQVGVLVALKYLPLAVLGLPAGALADRLPKRRLLIGCDLGRAAVLGTVPVAFAMSALGVAQLYAVTVLAGTLDVFFDVAHSAYVVGLVERDELVEANSRLQLSEQGASTLGPALAALLIAVVGGPVAVLVDAVSFLGSAAGLLLIRAPEPRPEPRPASRLGAEIAEGLRFVARRTDLRALFATSSLANLSLRMLSAILLLRLALDAGLAPAAIGLVLSIGEAGFLVGSFAAAPLQRRLGLPKTATVAASVIAVSGLPIALAPVPLAAPLTAAGLFIYGVAAVVWTITTSSYRQSVTPRELLARVGSVGRVGSWGTIPLASVLGGALGARIGVQPAMLVAALAALITPLPLLAWRRRRPRRGLYDGANATDRDDRLPAASGGGSGG